MCLDVSLSKKPRCHTVLVTRPLGPGQMRSVGSCEVLVCVWYMVVLLMDGVV
jgi:hypothetical protein